jgi:uncharacterized membrane protein
MADPPAPRGRSWWRWLLVASLGLNLAFVGLVAGAVLRGPPHSGPPAPGLWHYARAMPDAHRRDLGRALRASRPDWGGAREALRGQRTALAAALTAEPFDADAVAAILQEEARLTGTLAERGARMLMDQIAQMDAEERAAYADAILSERRRPRRGH